MNYLKAECLKFRRTTTNKLVVIAPIMTAAFAWIVSGFYGFQYMTFYWWYAFLLPGTIVVLCFLSHQKEVAAGRYYSVLSMPIQLKRFELAKIAVIAGKLLVAALFLALFTSLSNILSPTLAVYSPGRSVLGAIGITKASLWQIPICMYLVRRMGMLLPVFVNTVLGISLPVVLGRTPLVWLCPYCWAGKLAESLMGIGINGTFIGMYHNAGIPLVLLPALTFGGLCAVWEAGNFARREGK